MDPSREGIEIPQGSLGQTLMTLALALATPHSFEGREEPETCVHGLEAAGVSLLEMMQ